MSEFKEGLLEWLNSNPLPEDLFPLPWDLKITYMPIEVIRKKFEIMRTQYGAVVEQTDVTVNAINTYDKDTCFWACVKFIVYHECFYNGQMVLCGTASLLRGQYSGSWNLAQIVESLSITRAFSKSWKQFGKNLNKDENPIIDMKPPNSFIKNAAIKSTLSTIK